MTTGRDPNAWRTHEVPTFTETEDTWILGLTLKQLLMLGIVAALSYAVFIFSPLWFLPFLARIGVALGFALVGAAMVVIRPDGRSMFSVIGEGVSFMTSPKEYLETMSDLVSEQTVEQRQEQNAAARVRVGVLPGRPTGLGGLKLSVTEFVSAMVWRIKDGRRDRSDSGTGGSGGVDAGVLVVGVLVGFSLILGGCGKPVEAQSPVSDHYNGRRVYLQSIVVNFRDNINLGGDSANIRVKAATDLASAGPRVNETLQSVTELESHATRNRPAFSRQAPVGPIEPILNIIQADELVFNGINVGPYGVVDRPYCEINTIRREGVFTVIKRDGFLDSYKGRASSTDCRLKAPKAVADPMTGALDRQSSLSKPVISVNWQDRKRNQGAINIERGMFPYPGPWIESVEFPETANGFITAGPLGERLVDGFRLCDLRKTKVLSLGIQTEAPATADTVSYFPGETGYFQGQGGRRIAGQVQTCWLEPRHNVEMVLPLYEVMSAASNPFFDLSVQAKVTTRDITKINNIATLEVKNGTTLLFSERVPEHLDSDWLPEPGGDFPTVRFNLPAGLFAVLPKKNSTEPDSVDLSITIQYEHAVTVERPAYQPLSFEMESGVDHIFQCNCSCSGGGCTSTCGNRGCNRNASSLWQYFKYWDPHYTVGTTSPDGSPGEPWDREFLPFTPEAEQIFIFRQTVNFEPMVVTFDDAYVDLVYVVPTPEPGEVREVDYYQLGQPIGLQEFDVLSCSVGIDPATGWVYIPPGTNSKGEAFGGCRRNYACCISAPEVEELCLVGDNVITNEEYNCPFSD